MEAKREQTFVGLFVIIALAVLAATVFSISGAFGRSVKTYHAYFPFAGGLEPGVPAVVRDVDACALRGADDGVTLLEGNVAVV